MNNIFGRGKMIELLYENKNAIFCVKPHGLLSQSGRNGGDEPDMLGIISRHIGAEADLIHRLDRPTGGVMIFSKNKRTSGALSALVADKERCIKEYLAVVSGEMQVRSGDLCDYLFKDAAKGKSFVVPASKKGAKEARLSYQVISVADGEHGKLSLVKIRLGTGRTHQIRAQFSSRGLPIVGDGKYGSRERIRGEANAFGVSPKDMIALYAFRLAICGSDIARFDVYSLPDLDRYPFSVFKENISSALVNSSLE